MAQLVLLAAYNVVYNGIIVQDSTTVAIKVRASWDMPVTIKKEEDMTDAEIVLAFLEASMIPDPETAATYVADNLEITFTGGRKFQKPGDMATFNAKRYAWVKKKMGRTDVVEKSDGSIVYNTGTLYGVWPDGTEFEGNRYIDRFEVRNGKIAKIEVWNDSAERLLTMHGIEA